jgi:hypothetical protein
MEQSMNTGFGRFFAACLVAAASLGAIDQARAAAYVGAWDPLYGAPFTDLGWSGTVTFQVPLSPPCNTDGAACVPGAYVQDAHVAFYDINTNATLATIDWSTVALSGVAINSLDFDGNGDLAYLDTDLFPYLAPNVVGAFNPADYGNFTSDLFSLQFFIAQVVGNASISGPRLYWTEAGCEGDCSGGSNDPANRVDFRVTQIPEPATLALVMAALLAAGATKRRSRNS